jgi:hypothetical protein
LEESKKLYHLIILFFISPTTWHKGRKYLTIIEHIFYFIKMIIPFSCQNLRSIHASTRTGLKVDADYIPELGFSSRDFGSKYHNLYQGSQNVPAISSFTFTFSPVKNLSSMGFPTIFMFMWIVVIAFCWSISSYRFTNKFTIF